MVLYRMIRRPKSMRKPRPHYDAPSKSIATICVHDLGILRRGRWSVLMTAVLGWP